MQLQLQNATAQTGREDAWLTDYHTVERAIGALMASAGGSGGIDDARPEAGIGVAELESVLTRWCGLSPAGVAHAVGAGYARERLRNSSDALRVGPTSRGAIHAFDVEIVATITEDDRRRGAGLDITYGFHPSPFGEALLLMTEGGICGLAFVGAYQDQERKDALGDMRRRWPRSRFREGPCVTGDMATSIFGPRKASGRDHVPLILIGTPFDLQVWQALLKIPLGALVSYTQIAQHLGHPTASRAVGTANGRNPISFVVPCHRALRGDGSLGGYYWGLMRKRALIAWEAGQAQSIGDS